MNTNVPGVSGAEGGGGEGEGGGGEGGGGEGGGGEGGGGEGLRHTAPKLGEQVASIHGREGSPPHMAPQSSPKTESFGSPGCQLE